MKSVVFRSVDADFTYTPKPDKSIKVHILKLYWGFAFFAQTEI